MTARMFLFHMDEPKGKMFKVEYVAKHEDDLRKAGWVDTPALLDLPPEVPELTAEQAQDMAPDSLIAMVKGLGFQVMSDEEFEASVMRRLAEKEAMALEQDKNGRSIGEIFDEDNAALTKDMLVEFGNTQYSLELKKSMTEAAMIEAINAVRTQD